MSLTKALFAGAFLVFVGITPVFSETATGTPDLALIEKGKYLANLGDCFACHTAEGGKLLAGGKEMHTPFGALYSTNITPDKETGIGTYTFAQFDRAMRKGIDADGDNLYPAMPYTAFAKMTEPDMKALYAYLMEGVPPVRAVTPKNKMQWPFSMRFGLKFWNMLFLDSKPYRDNPAQSAQWNRGAYLVQGLGHCGSCHTPRGLAFQEKALSGDGFLGKNYLAGAVIEDWYAPGLRGVKSVPAVVKFLKTGRNARTEAFGTMGEVVHYSTQHFSDDDLTAMAVYMKSLPSNEVPTSPGSVSKAAVAVSDHDLYETRGGLGYVQFCATCHQPDGKGVDKLFPPLEGNPVLSDHNPESVIHVVLSGWKSPRTGESPHRFGMPDYHQLSDRELSEIVTFVRMKWGNQGTPVTPEQIREVREDLNLPPVKPSRFSVPRLASLLDSPQSSQLIYGMRLMNETKAMLPDNVGDVLNCSSCHLNAGTVADASPFVGLSAQFPSYAPRAGKVIDLADRLNGCFLRSMNGKALPKTSKPMLAMVAYIDWMNNHARLHDKIPGRGVGKISKLIVPDPVHGKEIYKNSCAVCHGDHGDGLRRTDGSYLFPPLWGDASFNIGAGIAKTYTAAAFVKNNMPMAHTLMFPLGQGGLTDQEAVDVSAYFTHKPRPDFPDKVKDWPHGGKPSDSRY